MNKNMKILVYYRADFAEFVEVGLGQLIEVTNIG